MSIPTSPTQTNQRSQMLIVPTTLHVFNFCLDEILGSCDNFVQLSGKNNIIFEFPVIITHHILNGGELQIIGADITGTFELNYHPLEASTNPTVDITRVQDRFPKNHLVKIRTTVEDYENNKVEKVEAIILHKISYNPSSHSVDDCNSIVFQNALKIMRLHLENCKISYAQFLTKNVKNPLVPLYDYISMTIAEYNYKITSNAPPTHNRAFRTNQEVVEKECKNKKEYLFVNYDGYDVTRRLASVIGLVHNITRCNTCLNSINTNCHIITLQDPSLSLDPKGLSFHYDVYSNTIPISELQPFQTKLMILIECKADNSALLGHQPHFAYISNLISSPVENDDNETLIVPKLIVSSQITSVGSPYASNNNNNNNDNNNNTSALNFITPQSMATTLNPSRPVSACTSAQSSSSSSHYTRHRSSTYFDENGEKSSKSEHLIKLSPHVDGIVLENSHKSEIENLNQTVQHSNVGNLRYNDNNKNNEIMSPQYVNNSNVQKPPEGYLIENEQKSNFGTNLKINQLFQLVMQLNSTNQTLQQQHVASQQIIQQQQQQNALLQQQLNTSEQNLMYMINALHQTLNDGFKKINDTIQSQNIETTRKIDLILGSNDGIKQDIVKIRDNTASFNDSQQIMMKNNESNQHIHDLSGFMDYTGGQKSPQFSLNIQPIYGSSQNNLSFNKSLGNNPQIITNDKSKMIFDMAAAYHQSMPDYECSSYADDISDVDTIGELI